jgi:hypothetical protein
MFDLINSLQQPSSSTLAEFLVDNEGQRCVVVLDVSVFLTVSEHEIHFFPSRQEIDKTEDEKVLWSLLMPWELGGCKHDQS